DRRVFDGLSVFLGGFRLEAAEAVCRGVDIDAYDVDDALGSLVDKSLLERDGRRYRLLETTRQFAADQLEQRGDAHEVRTAHMEYFRQFVHRAAEGLRGPDEANWDAWLRADWDNVRAAFQAACSRDDVGTATTIVIDLVLHGLMRQSEALLWTEEAF